MPLPRQDRNADTREIAARTEVWTEPSRLPDPYPNADYVYRYIRISNRGMPDPTNVSMRSREGWMPVSPTECPEVLVAGMNESPDGTTIDISGHRLCRMTKAKAEAGKRFYETKAKNQLDGANSQNMSDGAIHNRSVSRVVRGQPPLGNGE